MLLDVLVPSPIRSLESQDLLLTINANSFLELLGAVDDAVGDIFPLYGNEGSANGSLTTSASRRGCCYFIIQNIPWLPKLVISCEDTFGFLVEGFDRILKKKRALTPDALREEFARAPRPQLTLVANPDVAATAALCSLPRAVVATSSSQALSAAYQNGSCDNLTIAFCCSTEGLNTRIPLGGSLKEIWRSITSICPRITKGVHRLVTKSSSPSAGGLIIDVDNEDDYMLERPHLAVGSRMLEAIDMCRAGQPQLQKRTISSTDGLMMANKNSSQRPSLPLEDARTHHQQLLQEGHNRLSSGSVVAKVRTEVRGASLD